MKRGLLTGAVPLIGLLLSQCIATLQVYFSNADLYQTLLTLKEAGYLIVPNPQILPRLLSLKTAVWGGCFFTLSVGILLTFLSWSAAWAWNRLFSRNRLFFYFCFLAWLTSLILVNLQGFVLLITLHFLLIPAAVFVAAAKLPAKSTTPPASREFLLLVPLILLVLLWATQANSDFFLNLRDRLLLSNSLGAKISDFYYQYAYYPAEGFKSLEQKLLKSSFVESVQGKPVQHSIERSLLAYDYLPVDEGRHPVDLLVREVSGALVFQHKGKTILQTTLQEFLANPAEVLGQFSRKTDTSSPFRSFTLISLLMGLPVLFYALGFGLFFFISSFLLSAKFSAWMASVLCLFLGTGLIFYVEGGLKEKPADPAQALASERWETRVAALKLMEQREIEVGDFDAYPRLVKSQSIAERYWLVRALGSSRRTNTYRDLLGFLGDSNPGVVSMAFYSLGQRKDSRAVPEILRRIETSDNWHNQWYAYRALRTLGWKQSRSSRER